MSRKKNQNTISAFQNKTIRERIPTLNCSETSWLKKYLRTHGLI